jgi:hypothetical protein
MPDRMNLEKILTDPNSTHEERSIAHHELMALNAKEADRVEFSSQALDMMRSLGKLHLRDVSQTEWLQYAERKGLTGCEQLCTEYWNWNAPDDKVLQVISGKDNVSAARIAYWAGVRERTTNKHVLANATSQIKLESEGYGR